MKGMCAALIFSVLTMPACAGAGSKPVAGSPRSEVNPASYTVYVYYHGASGSRTSRQEANARKLKELGFQVIGPAKHPNRKSILESMWFGDDNYADLDRARINRLYFPVDGDAVAAMIREVYSDAQSVRRGIDSQQVVTAKSPLSHQIDVLVWN